MTAKPLEAFTPETLNNLALTLGSNKHLKAAICASRRAVNLAPTQAILWATLGMLYYNDGRYADAETALLKAIEIDPNEQGFYHNLGMNLTHVGRFPEALAALDKAIELDPASSAIRWDRSLARLLSGDWKNGFREYESRMQHLRAHYPRFLYPFWRGEPLEGKSIFVQCEQGEGDLLQFSRYLSWIKDKFKPKKLICAIPTTLTALFKYHPAVDEFLFAGEALPVCDYGIYMLSLPHIHGTTQDNVPPEPGHFRSRALTIKPELPPHFEGTRKIGIVWAGSPVHTRDSVRTALLEEMLPLITRTDLTLYSFQYGARAVDLVNSGAAPFVHDLSGIMSDWTVSAGMMAQMDAFIAVDTGPCHLAACVGIPTIMMLAHTPDWRWGWKGGTTPWYKNVRLVRQDNPGNWNGVAEHVTAHLDEILKDVAASS